jgi:4-amino-4-deoxy-L-arabinose transferase-like glycosyltransferase
VRECALLALVIGAAILALRGPSATQDFSVDESRWIATSRYFWITFIDHDLFGPEWQPNYLVYTHPPVARYIIGFGLWLQGWDPYDLNGRYDSLQGRLYNLREGNVPSDDLLHDARQVTLVFAVVSVALVYLIARQLGGVLAGLAAAALTLVNPLLTTVWTRALAESIVAAFGLLALAVAIPVMPNVALLGRRAWMPLLVGAGLALSAATKLSGGLGAIGLGLFAVVQQALALWETRRTRGMRAWVDVWLIAVVLFVAVNPLLYLMPVERAINLVKHRHDEMEFQRSVFKSQAVPDELGARVARVGQRTFDDYATPGGPLPVSPDVVLVPLGLLVLGWGAVRELRGSATRPRAPGPAFLVLSWTVLTYVVITPSLGFDSSHYFAPIVTANVIVEGVAVATVVWLAWRWGRSRLGRRGGSGAQNVQVPIT